MWNIDTRSNFSISWKHYTELNKPAWKKYIMYDWIFIIVFLLLNIYLFEKLSFTERGKIVIPCTGSLPKWPVGVGLPRLKPGVGSFISLSCVCRAPALWMSSAAFPVTLAGNWVRSGAARTKTGAYTRCQHYRQ